MPRFNWYNALRLQLISESNAIRRSIERRTKSPILFAWMHRRFAPCTRYNRPSKIFSNRELARYIHAYYCARKPQENEKKERENKPGMHYISWRARCRTRSNIESHSRAITSYACPRNNEFSTTRRNPIENSLSLAAAICINSSVRVVIFLFQPRRTPGFKAREKAIERIKRCE